MNDNETVEQAYEDIRKKIKKYKIDSAYEHIACMYTVFAVEDMIDRIEAAHRREVAELKSKMNDVVCENEAMRDACGTCCAKREVAELRECLREAVTEVCNRLEKCGFKEPCVFKTCYVQEWRKALKDEGGEK